MAAIAQRASAFYHQVITPPVDADYRTPEHFARTVPPRARGELADLLGALREFRSQMVGLTLGDAQVLYNGDGYAMLLGQEFDRWMTAHARARLAKSSPRDLGDPFFKFNRLREEFGAWVEALVLTPNSGHLVPLSRLHKKVSWELYRGTWSNAVVRDGSGLVVGIQAGHPLVDEMLRSVLEMNHWHREGLIPALAASHPELSASGPATNHADELRVIVQDLVEMRGLLVRSFVPSEHVLELAPGVFAGWSWEIGHLAGTVEMSTSAADAAQRLESGVSGYAFGLDMDGVPREVTTPWVEFAPGVSTWALGVVRPIHAHMLRLWDAAERPAQSLPGDAALPDEGEAIAAACEALALGDVAVASGGSSDERERPRVPAVRTITLLALLERMFGVEVKRGKGSEITVYRVGGRKYTLPNHKRNMHFPSHIVRAMLRALGIGAAEFRAAVGR